MKCIDIMYRYIIQTVAENTYISLSTITIYAEICDLNEVLSK